MQSDLRQRYGRFFAGLRFYADVWSKANRQLQKQMATEFNVFDFIRPDENKLSAIIAELLSPLGRHGQGTTFLKQFLRRLADDCKRISIPPLQDSDFERAVVACETATTLIVQQRRRIDIRIDFGDEFGIGIENKPWAIEQKDQLQNYSEDLEGRFSGRYVLLFLCQCGRQPKSLEVEMHEQLTKDGTFAVIHFSEHIVRWARDCRQVCEANKVRWFLQDFIHYLENTLCGDSTDPNEGDDS